MGVKTTLSRRDFLRLALTAGGTLALSPFIQACNRLTTSTPTSTMIPTPTAGLTSTPIPTPTTVPTIAPTVTQTATPVDLTAGLEGLDINRFLDESIKRIFLRDPETITIGGLSDLLGVRDDKLTNMSDEYIRETQRLQAGVLGLLRKYDKGSFKPDQKLDVDVYEWYLDDLVAGFPFMYNDYLTAPFLNSVTWNMNFLFTEAQPLGSLQEAQDYIARLSQMNTKFDQLLDGLRRCQAFGVILPDIIIPDALQDCEQYTGFIGSNPYYKTFVSKVSKISSLSATDTQTLLGQVETVIKESVVPAYKSLSDYFKSVEPISPKEIGVWRYSNGADYYAYILRHYTTTERTADEIHQLGLEHVKRIQAEMREEFGKLGYPADNSFQSLMNRLAEDSGYVAGDNAVAAYQAAIDQATGCSTWLLTGTCAIRSLSWEATKGTTSHHPRVTAPDRRSSSPRLPTSSQASPSRILPFTKRCLGMASSFMSPASLTPGFSAMPSSTMFMLKAGPCMLNI